MTDGSRTVISKKEISHNVVHTVSVSYDESIVYLKVDLTIEGKAGPFSTEKSFRNNIFGLEDMQITMNSLDTDQKVKKYFGIGE